MVIVAAGAAAAASIYVSWCNWRRWYLWQLVQLVLVTAGAVGIYGSWWQLVFVAGGLCRALSWLFTHAVSMPLRIYDEP